MSATMFSKKLLYIPDYVVYEDVPTIIKYFEDFNIAKVKSVQVFPHEEQEYYIEDRYNYGYAIIEIDYYYYNQGSCNFYNSIENNKCLMVYNDPLYWEVQFNPLEKHNTPNYIYNPKCIINENDNNSDEEYSYTSDPEDETADSDYVYNEESSIDDYNYESYKTKQKAKRQKLDEQLAKLKKTLEIIKNNQEKMHALLIKNNKVIGNSIKMSNNTDYKNNWARRLRIKY